MFTQPTEVARRLVFNLREEATVVILDDFVSARLNELGVGGVVVVGISRARRVLERRIPAYPRSFADCRVSRPHQTRINPAHAVACTLTY